MNIFNTIKSEVNKSLEASYAITDPALFQGVTVELPKDAAHGDLSTNAAMVVSKSLKMNPRQIAEALVQSLAKHPDVASAEVAGPGFVNLTMRPTFWQGQLLNILTAGTSYGDSTLGAGISVNIEYVSANPTGPLHIGHARGAVVGDGLALLLTKAGYAVTKEYYINDAGAQTDTLARSAFLRYREALGEAIGEIPAGLYPGDYLVPVGQALAETHGAALRDQPESAWLPIVRAFAIERMMGLIKTDLADLGIRHDVFASERRLHEEKRIEQVLQELEAQGLLYRGVLEPPKGKTPDDWEPREQLLFRSTDYDDDCDRPLAKSDGSFTYFAGDVAYARDKLNRGFAKLVMVLGADHGGYINRMKALVKVLSQDKASLEVLLCQLVKLFEAGQPFKMSKRAGTFITVRDVLEVVGKDVLRFVMLTRKPEQPLDFDLVKVQEQSKDNPVFYVQYAHARCKSLLRQPHAAEAAARAQSPDAALLARLTHSAELALIRKLCYWPRLVESAALAYEPHRVAYFLHDLASELHGLWTLGNDDPSLRFLQENDVALSAARLALARAVATVIASGLAVLGVEPVEEMR
jgi:arginyl-tRNA synthetase